MRAYEGFCPVAKAVEVLGDRWTLLIVRELLCGSQRFTEIEYGLPGISRSLLSERLRTLERTGIVERRADDKRVQYFLTPAGQELHDIVCALGEWGRRWVQHNVGPEDVEPQMLLWDMHRRIHLDRLPQRRVVVQFDLYGARRQSLWLVLERPEPSLCLKDPGFDNDLVVTADTVALHRVWMGYMAYGQALQEGLITVEGPRPLAQALPTWLALNMFAAVGPVATSVQSS